jgi:DNA polymerase-1
LEVHGVKTITAKLAGDDIPIYIYQDGDSFKPFADFIARTPYVGFDTETTGGSVWDEGWAPRLAQFGSGEEAHVLPAHMGRQIRAALSSAQVLVMHSAPADCITAARGWGVEPEPLGRKALDTLVLSRLIEPMGHSLRGADNRLNSLHGLKARVRQLVDPYYDADKRLKVRYSGSKALDLEKCSWGTIPLDDPVYLEYSGLDPVITVRLLETLWYLGGSPLISREHELMVECMLMTWRGMKIDRDYRAKLEVDMMFEAADEHARARAQGFPANGIAKKDDKLAVAGWLEQAGVDVPKTGTGAPSLAKDGLYLAIANHPIEATVRSFFKSKELNKLVNDYLSKMDTERCNPDIRSIGAVTGRQSVGNPPFHQLPDAVRGCIVPDTGYLLGAVDLDRIEFCVAAGLSQDPTMIEVIKSGGDLHCMTASVVYPDLDFSDPANLSPDAKEARQSGKIAGFGRMFGGGAKTLSLQTGVPEEEMAKFIQGFDRAYPETRKLGRRLGSQDWVINPWGRRIPADPIRRYGNLNYEIQSTAREIFVDGMLKCIKAGIQVLLPLHDEVIFQSESRESLETVVSCMSGEFLGVPITAGGKLMSRWSKG